MTADPVLATFRNMERWRHLPAYQLERRADIFFSIYLPAVIAEHTGVQVAPDVIPELPIQRSLIWPEDAGNQSVKVDYAVFSADRSTVYFVELKTDAASRRDRQDTYLSRSREVGFRRIVQGVVEVAQASKAYQKYGHLLHALAEHGCLRLPERLADHLWPDVRQGLGRLLREIEVTVADDEFRIEVLYVQPFGSDGDSCVTFESFAAHVARHDDPVSRAFVDSLRRWVTVAGSPRPGR